MSDDDANTSTSTPDAEAVELPDMPPAPDPTPDEPPKRDRSRRRTRAPKADATPKPDSGPKRGPGRPRKAPRDLTAELEKFYGAMALLAGTFGGEADALAVMENGEACAKAMNNAAAANPKLHAFIERAMTTSVMAEVALAHAPMVVRIAANHGAPVPPLVVAMMGGPAAPLAAVPDASGNGAGNN